MDYDALTLFLHLSRTLHFLRTSRACHVSPSALSRAVQRLERETGWPLFERDRRSVRLTPEGARFAAHARDTLERWERLQRELARPARHADGEHRDLRLGHRLPELPARAARRASASAIPTSTSSSRPATPPTRWSGWPRGASTSASRRSRRSVPRALVARVLLHTPLVFAAPRAAVRGRAPLPPPAAALGRAADRAAGRRARRATRADRWFRRRRVAPRVYGEVPGSEAILALVSLGCGVGIVPRIVLDESPLRGEGARARRRRRRRRAGRVPRRRLHPAQEAGLAAGARALGLAGGRRAPDVTRPTPGAASIDNSPRRSRIPRVDLSDHLARSPSRSICGHALVAHRPGRSLRGAR